MHLASGILLLGGADNIIALFIILGIILALYFILRISLTISYHASSITNEVKLSAKWLWLNIYPRPDKPKKPIKIKAKKKKKSKKSSDSVQTIKDDISEIEEEFVELSEDELDERIESLEKELENQKQSLNQSSEISDCDKKNASEKAHKNIKKDKRLDKSANDKPDDSGLKAKLNRAKVSWNRYKDFIPMTRKSFGKLLKQIRFYDTEIEITAGKDDAYDAAMNYGRMNALLFNGLGMVGLIFTLYKPKKAEVKCVFDKKVFEYELSGKIKLRLSTVLGIGLSFGTKFLCLFLKKRHKAKKQYKLKKKLMLNKRELLENE